MPIDIQAEIKKVQTFYANDTKQKGFNALFTGEMGTGKTFILRTARLPVWIDSFDPGGSVCLEDEINQGKIIADTQYESDDPYKPSAFKKWKKNFDERYKSDFFNHIGTYCIDSSTSFSQAVMDWQLHGGDKVDLQKSRAGEAPKFTKDYTPQKIEMQNRLRRILSLPCDFILTAHLRTIEKKIGTKKDGEDLIDTKYRYMAVGQAAAFIPTLFNEVYVFQAVERPHRVERRLLLDSTGEYLARSRMKKDGLLDQYEETDIKKLLKKSKRLRPDLPLFNDPNFGKGGEIK
jgi:hypothetical protein